MRNITYETYTHMSTLTGNANTTNNIINAFNYLSEQIGGAWVDPAIGSGGKGYWYHTSNPNYAIYIGETIANSSTSPVYGRTAICTAYKDPAGNWINIGTTGYAPGGFDEMISSKYGVRFNVTKLDGTPILIELQYVDEYAGTVETFGYFGMFSFTDYFTAEQRSGCFSSYLTTDGMTPVEFVGCTATADVFGLFPEIIIGGDTYPTRQQSVAAPVAFTSQTCDFYGHVVDSTFLYAIFAGAVRVDHGLKSQVSIGGHTFVQLVGNYFARID